MCPGGLILHIGVVWLFSRQSHQQWDRLFGATRLA